MFIALRRTPTRFTTGFLPLITILAMLSTWPGQLPAKDVSQADAPQRQIALSFDDAPRGHGQLLSGRARTAKLIEALKRTGVKGAGFFVLTENVEKFGGGRARIEAYQAAGHVLANHTHSHPSLHRTEVDRFLEDVDRASGILSRFNDTTDLFRFPFLHEGDTHEKRIAVRNGLAERGLRNAYVTVDTYDWYLQALVDEAIQAGHRLDRNTLCQVYVDTLVESVEFYDSIAQDVLGRSPRHVLLLHENDLAALFVDDLVIRLRELGWNIIPITDAYEDEIARSAPNTLFNNQGRVAAVAHAMGAAPKDLVHPSEDERYLRALFERHGLLPLTERAVSE